MWYDVRMSYDIAARLESLEGRVAELERRPRDVWAELKLSALREFLETTEPGECAASALYAGYLAWAAREGRQAVTMTMFGRRMRLAGLGSRAGRGRNVYPVRLARKLGV